MSAPSKCHGDAPRSAQGGPSRAGFGRSVLENGKAATASWFGAIPPWKPLARSMSFTLKYSPSRGLNNPLPLGTTQRKELESLVLAPIALVNSAWATAAVRSYCCVPVHLTPPKHG